MEYTNERHGSKICKELLKFNKKNNKHPNRNMGKNFKGAFSKIRNSFGQWNLQRETNSNKNKNPSAFLGKWTMRYHYYIPNRRVNIWKSTVWK